MKITIDIATQTLYLLDKARKRGVQYSVSTALNGIGEQKNSGKTPRGTHIIRAKIGKNCPVNTVFVNRRPTGEIYEPDMKAKQPNRDWILTRILWLSGLEVGKNRLGLVDTMQRYIYIHGIPDEVLVGKPGSKGCIRMHNDDLLDLYHRVSVGCFVEIKA